MSADNEDHEGRIHVIEKMVSILETSNDHVTRQLAELIVSVKAMRSDLRDHEVKEMGWHAEAFPGGDMTGHRKEHEARIAASKAQEDFWRELRLDIAKKGTWVLLVTILGLGVAGFVTKGGIAGLFVKAP